MKCLTLALLTIFVCPNLIAQTDNHSFGKVDKQELLLKDCDFENNAAAMVLFDIGEYYYDQGFRVNERFVRIKIFNDKGLDRANVKIRFFTYHNDEQIKNISGQTYNLDAAGNIVITKLDKKTVFSKKLNKRYSEVAFTLPEVKAGSVIEYKYTQQGMGAGSSSWYFQKSIPVLFSEYKVNFPLEVEMQCQPICTLPYQSKKENKSNRDIQIFFMEKIPALNDEAFISCDEDYLQKVEARVIAVNYPGRPRRILTSTWQEIIKDLMEDIDFGLQLNKNIPRTDDLELLLKPVTSPYKKMTIIHDYVRNNMKWNEYDNIWALDGVKSAWKDKKGTSGEINLILVNLLKDAGLNAHPVLISTRNHGRVNIFAPSTRQFNKVMAYVEIDKQVYVLDATEKFTPSRLIPQEALASEGLVIEKPDTFEWGWRTLWNKKEVYQNTVFLFAEVDSNGVMKGNATVTSSDHARVERANKLAEGKEPFIKAFYTPANPDLKIDSLNFQNEKIDSLPLVQNISFTEILNSSGDYKYFTANIFSGLEKNSFVADNRFSDIFFGYDQQISIVGSVSIPDNYEFEELPKNIKMIMPDTGIVFTRMSGVNENLLSLKITVDFKKPIYEVAEYELFKEFYKKMFNLLNEQFVIKRKS